MNEIDIRINFRNKKTIGEQLSSELQRLIEQGSLQAGTQLPPVRTLAAKLLVNFNTVARAYRQLDMKGLITTQQGRGTYVLEQERSPVLPEPFSEEEFLHNLDSFLLEEAQRTGRLPANLWEIGLKYKNPIPTSTEPVRKRKWEKANRKPGWRSWKANSGIQYRMSHVQKLNRLRLKKETK